MKLSSDSAELTAYALHELPPSERAEVEAALARSPELKAEMESLQATAALIAQHLAAEARAELSPSQRAAILRRSTPDDARPELRTVTSPSSPHEWWRALRAHWMWATAAFAALAVTLSVWPRSRSADLRLQELRYQTPRQAVPAALPSSEPTANSPDHPEQTSQLALLDDATGASPSDSPQQTPVTPARIPAEQNRVRSAGRAADLSSATDPAAGSDSALGVQFYQMDPVLARRYGLMPRQGAIQLGKEVNEREKLDPRSLRGLSSQAGSGLTSYQPPAASAGDPLSLGQRSYGESRRESGDLYLERLTRESGSEDYAVIADNPFQSPIAAPLSTFGLDVDTASYANVRRFLRQGSLPPANAVRIEELINYFRYDYPLPRAGEPFAAAVEIADCPWKEGNKLVRIGLQAKAIAPGERPRANLVFLLDVSGSMDPENKLPLVKRSLRLLLDRLGERDAVSIVTYAGESRIALEPTPVTAEGRQRLGAVIEGLRAGSGTAGSVGIQNAYTLATDHFISGGVNRVILCTDGDFNIGITDPGELHRLIEEKAKSGVFLSVLGYGIGNTKDSTMELLADKGNGNYAYVDSFAEARKVLAEQLEGTLVTVAKDVKVQAEFNPARVKSYRLLGYENRQLRDRDFNDDTKDAGEVGSGHQVTVLYEIQPAVPNLAGTDPLRYQSQPAAEAVPAQLKPGHENELLNLKIRYQASDGHQSRLIEQPIQDAQRELNQASADLKFAAAVAGYGMLLRNSTHKGDLTWETVLRLAEQGLGPDKEGYRAEFVDLARKAHQLSGGR